MVSAAIDLEHTHAAKSFHGLLIRRDERYDLIIIPMRYENGDVDFREVRCEVGPPRTA